MTSPTHLIFTPPQLVLLGLEHDPNAQNEMTPYPYVFDRANGVGLFFDPLHDMASFRMLERALTRKGWQVTIFSHPDAAVPFVAVSFSESSYGPGTTPIRSPDLITAYVAAAFALVSP